MKSILLTTTALVAFAGAAAAEVTFSGSAALGYNDDGDVPAGFVNPDELDNRVGDNKGFYWDGNLAVNLTQELDNGVTAGVAFDFDFSDTSLGDALESGGYVLSLTTENAGMFFGDTAFAAETRWSGAGDMEADAFSEADGETALRGDITFGDIEASVSYVISDADGNRVNDDISLSDDVDQLSLGASGDFGNFNVVVAYQEESIATGFSYDPEGENGDFNANEIFGISAGTTFAGATVRLAYAEDLTADESSLGVQVAYPFGPITATVYYVAEDDGSDEDNYGVTVAYSEGPIAVTLDYDYDQGVNKTGLDGSYDLGNGLTVLAGVYNQSDDAGFTNGVSNEGTDFYVAGVYDLGSGASLLISYADAETGGAFGDDEVGAPDYQVGTTVEVSFEF